MTQIIYPIVILVVAVWSIAGGFRRGITRQLASLLGLGFGAVASRVLCAQFSQHFQWTSQISQAPEFAEFSTNLVCGVTIYFIVYWLFSLLSVILRRIMEAVDIGIFNRLLGAFFSLLKNLLWVSIVFNLILCFSKASGLLEYEKSGDGNLVEAVMALTPAILGCYGAEDFAYFHQLKEAKTISYNFTGSQNVIFIEYQG